MLQTAIIRYKYPILAILLGAFFLQSFLSVLDLSPTTDEVSHIPAGYTYATLADFRLNPQHPPLLKLISGNFLRLIDIKFDPTLPSWLNAEEWTFGNEFLLNNDFELILITARLPLILLAVLLGIYIFKFAEKLFGLTGALISLTLYSFSPNIIAHSHFVTFDMGLTAFIFISFYHLWNYSKAAPESLGEYSQLLLASTFFACSLLSKFSALAYLPFFFIFIFAKKSSGLRPLIKLASSAIIISLIICICYNSTNGLATYIRNLSLLNADHMPNYATFMAGKFYEEKISYYFIYTWLLKSPLPEILMTLIGAFLIIRNYKNGKFNTWSFCFFLFPNLSFLLFTSLFAAPLGIRYILPLVPFSLLLCGSLSNYFNIRSVKWSVGLLLIWQMLGSLITYPEYLAYFNETIDRKSGYKYLDDSNIDWGQDLKKLSKYINDNNLKDYKLLYSWIATPLLYNLDNSRISVDEWRVAPQNGVYIITTQTLVRGIYFAKKYKFNCDWLTRYKYSDRIGYSFFVYKFPQ